VLVLSSGLFPFSFPNIQYSHLRDIIQQVFGFNVAVSVSTVLITSLVG